MQRVLEHHAAGLTLGDGPGGPANEPVDRVARRRLVESELVCPSAELVGAALHPVGPRDQDLSPARRAHFVLRVAVEQIVARDSVRPQPAAESDDDGALLAERELDLLP